MWVNTVIILNSAMMTSLQNVMFVPINQAKYLVPICWFDSNNGFSTAPIVIFLLIQPHSVTQSEVHDYKAI